METSIGRVFVSSVFGGMMDLRRMAGEAAERLGLQASLTEDIPANPSSVEAKLGEEIARSDIYLGVFDTRRGTVPAGGDGEAEEARAITERELVLARELGLRCVVFLSKSEGREPKLEEFLEAHVTDYSTGVWARPYGSPDDLRREIVAALSVVRPRVRLMLEPGIVRLDLSGIRPVWAGAEVIEEEQSSELSSAGRSLLELFLGSHKGGGPKEDALRVLGEELTQLAFPGRVGEALRFALDRAAGRLILLELEAGPDRRYWPWELVSLDQQHLVKQGQLEIVRRVPDGGHTATVPADNLSVLGFTASPLEDRRERIKLGSEGGFGQDVDLFWEAEQERLLEALDPLLVRGDASLVLPEEGSRTRLRQELAKENRPAVLHVSCHGGATEKGVPALFLEDDEQHRAPTTAEDLVGWLHAGPGRPLDLAVLSSCYTASSRPGDVGGPGHRVRGGVEASPTGTEVASLVEELCRQGTRAAVGMQTSVSDTAALAFTSALYGALGRGLDLPVALQKGRTAMESDDAPHEWAVPVLVTAGSSEIVGPLVVPSEVPTADAGGLLAESSVFKIGETEYLEAGYVGRRDFERRLGRAVEETRDRPVVVHGFGGLGKSTLVSRFLVRRRAAGETVWPLVVTEEQPASALADKIYRALEVERSEGVGPGEEDGAFRKRLRHALRSGRCHLLLDNFEVLQAEDGAFLDPETETLLEDLTDAGGREFSLLITSRRALPRARNLDLGELPKSARRKFRLLRPALRELPVEAWDRIVKNVGGHPKALEILDGYLLESREERIAALLNGFETAGAHVHEELARERQRRGRKVLLDQVLEVVDDPRRATFDRLCLVTAPCPVGELIPLLKADGVGMGAGDVEWLRSRGYLATVVTDASLVGGVQVHRLLAARWQDALAEAEGPEAVSAWHARLAEHFATRPGLASDFGLAAMHAEATGDFCRALKYYSSWAASLRDRHAYRAAEEIALRGISAIHEESEKLCPEELADLWLTIFEVRTSLAQGDRVQALEWAQQFLRDLPDEPASVVRARLSTVLGRHLHSSGDSKEARKCLEAASLEFERLDMSRERAVTLGDIARMKAQSGDLSGALALHEEELRTYESLGDVRSRAVTLGDIARMKAQSGDLSGALALHEEQLSIFESLGDVRSRAVTLGDIANLRMAKGEREEARCLQEERLEVNRRLDDTDGIAAALYDLARIDLEEEDVDAAVPRLMESWSLFLKLGRADALVAVGSLLGQILLARDAKEPASQVLAVAEAAARKLGWTDHADHLATLLAQANASED